MSRRRRRSRRRSRRPASRRPLVYAALGALLGLALTLTGASFQTPTAAPPEQWRVISPALDESQDVTGLGRGTHVADGALQISRHAFFRSDTLVPALATPVGQAHLRLAPDSDAVMVGIGGGDGGAETQFDSLHPDGFWSPGGGWTATTDGAFTLAWEGALLTLTTGGTTQQVGRGGPGAFELAAKDGLVRIEAVTVEDTRGGVIFAADYAAGHDPVRLALGVVVGLLAGLGFGVVVAGGGPVATHLAATRLLPPALVCFVSPLTWILAVERLYLTRTPAWELARWCLGLSFVPIVWSVLAATPALSLVGGASRSWRTAGAVAALVAAALASRTLMGPDLLLGVLGAAWLAAPLLLLRDQVDAWVPRDLPALVAVAVLGWSGGLLVAVLWRLAIVGASARHLLDKAPRVASDLLFLLLLSLPAGAEALARVGYLDEAWNITKLSMELPSEQGWREPVPGWTDSCGDGAIGVIFAGGSSTGGAYQFASDPTAFFSAQAHEALCAQGYGLTSYNYGDGGRDSFTVARSLEQMFAHGDAELVVLYVGVNDLLTRHHQTTRKEREQARIARSTATEGLAGLGRRLRLTTAISLWLKGLPDLASENVSDVPLPEAEENHRTIAELARAHGAQVLLLTEYTDPVHAGELAPYGQMQRELAEELDGVHWIDVRPVLQAHGGKDLLVDRNHLSRQGNALLGQAIAEAVPGILR